MDGKESPFLVVTSCQTYLSAVLLIGACAIWLKHGWYTQWIEQESVPAVRILTFSVLISCESCCSPITSVWRGKNELTFSAQDGCEEVITEMLDFFFEETGTVSWQVHCHCRCSFQRLSSSIEMKVRKSHHLGMNFAGTARLLKDWAS